MKRRTEELAASCQAEREKMEKEVASERESRLEYVALQAQLARERKMADLSGLDAEIAARKKELGRLIGDIAGQRVELALIETEIKEKLAREQARKERGG